MTDCPKYNRELLDPITPTVRIIVKITIILGVLLNLSIIKYRNLANLILYFESIASTIYVLIPTKEYLEFSGFFFMLSAFIVFTALYCDVTGHVIINISCYAFTVVFIQTICYDKDLTIQHMLYLFVECLGYFLCCALVAMIIVYIQDLH